MRYELDLVYLFLLQYVGINRLIRQQLDIIFHFPHERKSRLGTGLCETGVIMLSSLSLTSEDIDAMIFIV